MEHCLLASGIGLYGAFFVFRGVGIGRLTSPPFILGIGLLAWSRTRTKFSSSSFVIPESSPLISELRLSFILLL